MVFKKKLFFYFLFTLTLTACKINKGIEYNKVNIKKIEIGMSMKTVISIMGKDFEILTKSIDSYDIGYMTNDNYMYRLSFKNSKVIRLNRENLSLRIDLK